MFICSLFIDAVSKSDYIVSNDRTVFNTKHHIETENEENL
jgi:hypothetical protein